MRIAIGCARFALAVSLAACAKPPEAPKGPSAVGSFTVVSYASPGISALSDSAARLWVDRVAVFRPSTAIFADDTCFRARYVVKRVTADSFFTNGFRVDATKLGFDADSSIWITEVWCGDESWSAAGGLLMWLHPDTVYTVWSGEFLKMARKAPGA